MDPMVCVPVCVRAIDRLHAKAFRVTNEMRKAVGAPKVWSHCNVARSNEGGAASEKTE